MNDATNGQDWVAPGQVAEPPRPDAAPAAAQSPAPGVIAGAVPYAPQVVTAVAPVQAAPTYRSWQPGIIPLRPVSFGEFISVPFKAMRFNRGVVVGGPLICVGVAMLLLAAALWLAFTDPSLALLAPTDSFTGVQGSTIAVGIAAFVALILAEAIACGVVAPGVARAVLGEKLPVGEAFKTVGRKFGALVLLWLLTNVAIVLAMAPGIIAILVGASNDNSGLIAIGWLGALALAVLGGFPIYLMGAIARCVVVLERKGAVASIRRTLSVIKGRFWWSVLIVLVTGAIIYVVTQVVQTMLSFVGLIALGIGVNGEWVATAVFVLIMVVGAIIAYVFTYAYMGSVYALIYTDARIRHEGFDLDLARAAEARRS